MKKIDDDPSVVKRDLLYKRVLDKLSYMAKTAAPGSITPETFARVSVDIVLHELLSAGAIDPSYRKEEG